MSEVGVEIVKTEETEKNKIKYMNINVSDSEVERNPDIVRLCADAGILEYVKPSSNLISRDELLKAIDTWDKFGYSARYGLERLDKDDKEYVPYIHYDDVIKCIKGMPSVNPQEPKTGHWIDKDEKSAVCSCCNRNNTLYGDFCKWCGAKMVDSPESEEISEHNMKMWEEIFKAESEDKE